MPRAKAILQSDFPYHITARCINQEWFQLSMPTVWNIFCEELSNTINDKKLLVHSFVLMSNHFHLLASTPDANISTCMHQFMQRSSVRLTRAGNRTNETFAGRHYKCILQHPNYFLNAYKYTYRNPVNAGVCSSVVDYPFSTLQWLINNNISKFKLCEDFTFLNDPAGTIRWLDTAPSPEKLEGVRFGLKRQLFQSKKDRISNKELIAENDVL